MRFFVLILIIFFNTSAAADYKNGMVVAEKKLATEVGINILKQGGNAIDAAVAIGYALAVVDPCCGNIGGGGMMTIHLANGKNIFLNFREKAPLKANSTMFEKKDPTSSTIGYLAVAVPGTVLGLDTALKKFGTMTRKQVMAPAIALAEKGYLVSDYQAKEFAEFKSAFIKQPNVAAIFLKNGETYQSGELLIQKDLANTLKAIAQSGPEVFYKSYIAHKIVEASNQNGGILSLEDFAKYNVKFTRPITCSYKDYTIISAPPPSSGGTTLCEMLNILENFPLQKYGLRSVDATLVLLETMRQAYVDRNNKLGDPDFVYNPVERLISKEYAKEISNKILNNIGNPIPVKESSLQDLPDTTHFSVLDKKGNAVSITYTLNGLFGALVIPQNLGFFLNSEMDDFATQAGKANAFGLIQSDANAIAPGKRPLSSMTPTIIMKNGKLFMIIGSPGGPRIITSVLLTILNVLEYKFDLQQAVDAPRIHFQAYPNIIYREQGAINFYTQLILEYLNYQLSPIDSWSAVEAIMIDPLSGNIIGANDNRRPDGAALGY